MENQEELKACNVSQDLIQSKQIRAKGKCTESYKLTNFPTYNAEHMFFFFFLIILRSRLSIVLWISLTSLLLHYTSQDSSALSANSVPEVILLGLLILVIISTATLCDIVNRGL